MAFVYKASFPACIFIGCSYLTHLFDQTTVCLANALRSMSISPIYLFFCLYECKKGEYKKRARTRGISYQYTPSNSNAMEKYRDGLIFFLFLPIDRPVNHSTSIQSYRVKSGFLLGLCWEGVLLTLQVG